jgi:hypothetical protein
MIENDLFSNIPKNSPVWHIKEDYPGSLMGVLFSRVYGRTRGRLNSGEPVGFLENWITDLLDRHGSYGMHDEDKILHALLPVLFSHGGGINFSTPDQLAVAEERRQFDEKYPDASKHYRGRYWKLFCWLLERYLKEREKETVFYRVEDWVFDEYDRMMEEFTDEQLPEVIYYDDGQYIFYGAKPPAKSRRPSRKDGGRIVKGIMSYITEKQWFGKEYVPRS